MSDESQQVEEDPRPQEFGTRKNRAAGRANDGQASAAEKARKKSSSRQIFGDESRQESDTANRQEGCGKEPRAGGEERQS
jgi:hypothetical protein